MTEYVTPALAVTVATLAPEIEYVVSTPAVLVIEYLTPALVPVTEYVTPPARVIECVAPAPSSDHMALPSEATRFSLSLNTTGFVNLQFFPSLLWRPLSHKSLVLFLSKRVQRHTVEQFVHVPTPQIQGHIEESVQVEEQIVDILAPPIVEGSLPSVDELSLPVYNQIHQEHIAAEQESIERLQQHTAEHITHVPIPQIQEQIVEGTKEIPQRRVRKSRVWIF